MKLVIPLGFDWDDANTKKNWKTDKVSSKEAEEVFKNKPIIIIEDREG